MNYPDSLLKPRESTLMTGWRMEETSLEDSYLHNLPESSSSNFEFPSLDVPPLEDPAESDISGPSKKKNPRLPVRGSSDLDSGYGSSHEGGAASKRKKLQKRSRSRARRDAPRTIAPELPSTDEARESSETPRGRTISLKSLVNTLRPRSKSRERVPGSSLTSPKQSEEWEVIPPVPAINLPVASKFMRSTSSLAVPSSPAQNPPSLNPRLWNNDTLLPSSQPTTPQLYTSSTSDLSTASGPSTPPTPTPSSEGHYVMSEQTEVAPVPAGNGDHAGSKFPFPPPPIPSSDSQPKSFLSMAATEGDAVQGSKPRSKSKSRGILATIRSGSKERKAAKTKKEKDPTTVVDRPSGEKPPVKESYAEMPVADSQFSPTPWLNIPDVEPSLGLLEAELSIQPPELFRRSPTPELAGPLTPNSAFSHISEYNPYSPHLAAAIYAQQIPTINRGRQTPFPERPILPPDMVKRVRLTEFKDVPRYQGVTIGRNAQTADLKPSRVAIVRPDSAVLPPSPTRRSSDTYI